jgi:hypothetical protein
MRHRAFMKSFGTLTHMSNPCAVTVNGTPISVAKIRAAAVACVAKLRAKSGAKGPGQPQECSEDVHNPLDGHHLTRGDLFGDPVEEMPSC